MLLDFYLQLGVKSMGCLEMFHFDGRVATTSAVVAVLGTLLLSVGSLLAQHLYFFEVVGPHFTILLLKL